MFHSRLEVRTRKVENSGKKRYFAHVKICHDNKKSKEVTSILQEKIIIQVYLK